MKKHFTKKRKMSGVALIVVIGVLSLLVIIGTYFAINMQLEYKAASNYLNSIKAKYLAEMGIQKTIADIRNHVKTDNYDDLIDYIQNYDTTEQEISGVGTYQIFIGTESANVGEDEKTNLNALNDTDFTSIDALYALGLSYDDIAALIDYKDPDADETTSLYTSGGWVDCAGDEANAKNLPFITLEEIKIISTNIDDKYDSIKDDLTIFGPIIRGGLLAEYYGDITGFNKDTILTPSNYKGKVIELGEIRETGMPGADDWAENHDSEFAGEYLACDLDNFGFDYFGVRWEGYIDILPSQVGSPVYFWTRSDDGNRLYIDGELIIDNWELHGMWDLSSTESAGYTFESAGWHQIKLEYYDNDGENSIWLKWDTQDHSGWNWTDDSVPFVPAECLGYYAPTWTDYDSGGYYKITSTGQIKSSAGNVLAEDKITVVAKIFGVWTQTTRAEFYTPWYYTYDQSDTLNCSDGAINCVTFLDSCPTNSSDDWDSPGYQTVTDSLKLGFWDNFDEDVGYTMTMLDEAVWSDVDDYYTLDGDNELRIHALAYESIEVEINGAYYWLDSSSSYDLFARVWEYDTETCEDREEPPWCVGWLFAKHWSYNWGLRPRTPAEDKNYYTLLKDEYLPYWTGSPVMGGLSEINLDTVKTAEYSYSQGKVLGITGRGATYQVYVNDTPTVSDVGNGSIPGSACLMTSNLYDYGVEVPPNGFPKSSGGTSEFTTWWDNVRIIPKRGWFISTPCSAGEKVTWGIISWTEKLPSGTDIVFNTRTADTQVGLGTAEDAGWSDSYTTFSGEDITSSDETEFIQYKATLSTVINYPAQTPVLEDVTITYLPSVEILYWQKVTE